jgi:hypothetical protein
MKRQSPKPATFAIFLLALAFFLHNSTFTLLFADPPPGTFYQFNGASAATLASGSTVTLARLGSVSSYSVSLSAGSAPYTVNLCLSDTAAPVHPGDQYFLDVNYPASTNPTLNVFDSGTNGTLLDSSSGTAIAGYNELLFVNTTGTAWTAFHKGAMLTKNLGAGVQTALGAAPNSAGGFVTGSGLASGTAAASGTSYSLGQRIIMASSIPGVVENYVPNSSGTDNGTDCAPYLNPVLESGTVHVIFDKNWTASTLYLGSHTTIENLPGVIFRHKACNNHGITNYNKTCVNISGSAGTGLSTAAVGYGNTDITIEGGIWDFNGSNEPVVIPGTGFAYSSALGSGTNPGIPVLSAYFSGVDGLTIRNAVFVNARNCSLYIGNSRYGVIENLLVTESNLNFPGAIPGLSGSAAYPIADGIRLVGSDSHFWITDCSRTYGGDIVLEVGPGDGQGLNQDGPVFGWFDGAIDAWADFGNSYDINVDGLTSNGGGIALLGETAAYNGTGHTMYSGTNQYPNGSVYVPVIQSRIHDVSLDGIHIESVDATQPNYAFTQPYAFITESYTDTPPAGYPAVCANISVNGMTLDSNAQVAQSIDISGSDWILKNIKVPQFGKSYANNTGAYLFGVHQNSSYVTIDGVQVGGTANATGFPTLIDVTGPADHLTVSNVRGTGLSYYGFAYDGQSDIGGSGNQLDGLTATLGAQNGGSWFPVWGQFTKTLGGQAADNYSGSVLLAAGTDSSFQSPASTAALTGAGAFIQGLNQLGIYGNSAGMILEKYANNGSGTAPAGFGGLWNNAQSSFGSFTSGTSGGYFTNWMSLAPTPPPLLTGSAVTFFAVDNVSSASADRGILSVQYGSSPYTGFSLEGQGTSQACWFVSAGSPGYYTVQSGTSGLTNQSVAYFGIYDGGTGISLRTVALSGSADVTVSGTIPAVVATIPSGTPIGLCGRGSWNGYGESTTLLGWLITTGSMSVSTENAVLNLFKNNVAH